MKRIGGIREVIPELSLWLLHKVIGHPINAVKAVGLIGISYWCTECGACNVGIPPKSKCCNDCVERCDRPCVCHDK